MTDQDDIGGGGLMGSQPVAEYVAGNVDGLVSLVARVDLGMYDMCLGQSMFEIVVDMGRKGAERGVVAHEAMDVDHQQRAPLSSILLLLLSICP